MEDTYEECESCYGKVGITEMKVKDTPDGICIYCPKCTEHHKFLDNELRRLVKFYNIDTKKLK
jgi:hypothetical protein